MQQGHCLLALLQGQAFSCQWDNEFCLSLYLLNIVAG